MKTHHMTHPEIVNRLRRIEGHVAKIAAMIEGGSPCTEVAQQMQAAESAMTSAKRAFVEDHIEHCFDEETLRHPRQLHEAIAQFRQIAKYL